MGNAIKFIKNKLCKTCNKELYFKNFRKVKPFATLEDMKKILTFYTNKINKINNL